ncbi:hypothetical protein TB2_033720 [Malus domestica]
MVGMASGRSAIKIGDKAMEIYKSKVTPKNQVFKLQHAWDVLKDCPRWRTDANQQWGRLFQREATLTNAGDDGVNEDVDKMTPTPSFTRPPRREKQKEAKRKGKSQDPSSGHIATEIAKLSETHRARQEEAARMCLQIKEEGDRKQERFEINLMMEDLNKYTSERKKYLRGMQREILQRDARKSIFQDDNSSQGYIPSPPSPNQDGGYQY